MALSKLLLIAYKFPPYAGVGGYRWAQLCKYLARLDTEIHVVTVKWDHLGKNSLLSAVQHPNIHIHQIPSGYPHNLALRDFGNRLQNGVRNKLFIHLINKFFPFDMAQHWDRYLLPFCKKLIAEHAISSVIATGHPFMANVHAAHLKKELPHICLIQDMRDMWFSDRTTYHSLEKHKQIQNLEEFALQSADAVVTVSEGCRQLLQRTAGTTPVYVIRNGYDPEKFQATDHNADDGRRLFVYLGNLSGGREECADAFLNFLRTYSQGRAIFAGSMPSWLLEKYADLLEENRLVFLGAISQAACIDLLRQANFALHFNGKNAPEAASTKIYEYAASGCPVLSFHFGGEPELLIAKHQLGISIRMDSADCDNSKLRCTIDHFDLNNFSPYNISECSFPELAKKYKDLVEKTLAAR